MSPARGLLRCEKGAAAVEFAFIAMLLILGTVGLIEIGRALFMMNELAHAADRAARVVMLKFDTTTTGDLTSAVQDPDFLTGLVPENVRVDIVPDPPANSDRFRDVTLSYDFTPMVSGLTIGAVTLTAERRVAK